MCFLKGKNIMIYRDHPCFLVMMVLPAHCTSPLCVQMPYKAVSIVLFFSVYRSSF